MVSVKAEQAHDGPAEEWAEVCVDALGGDEAVTVVPWEAADEDLAGLTTRLRDAAVTAAQASSRGAFV